MPLPRRPHSEAAALHANGDDRHDGTTAELRQSELRYRRLFETAKDGIFLLDAVTGRITDVNPFLVEMLGYPREELIGRALWEIGPVKDIAASQEAMRRLQDEEYIRYEDLPLETKSKVRVQVEFVSNVYLAGGEKVIQCNVRDITARKLAEAEALQRNEELRRLVAEMTLRDREMSRLNQMNDLLHACETEGEAHEVVALMAGDLFPGHSGFLAMFHPQDRRLATVARWGERAAIVPMFDVGDCWAMKRGRPHGVTDPRDGLVCRHFIDQPATGYLCVPMSVRGETLGLLCVIGAAGDASRAAVQQQVAVTMGEAIKLSLSNLRLREELREQATLDVLTGLHNRRYLDEELARELHRAVRRKAPLCVAMLDLDHFKRFNDTFGHDAGDAVLRELGRVLAGTVRKSDVLCRYGGEEFVLVLPDSSLADARHRVEQIRALVGETRFRHGSADLGTMTVSAGVVEMREDDSSPGDLLRAADEALYAAKLAGRDRVAERRAGPADPGAPVSGPAVRGLPG